MQYETFAQKWKKNSDMDWAQHIKMDYAQNLRKDPVKAKKDPHKISTGYYFCPFHSFTEPGICSNFGKFVQNCNF